MSRRFLLSALAFAIPFCAQAAILKVTVNDMIHPISDEFIGRALTEAARTNDDAVVIELRTPGGLIESTRSIVEKIMTSRVPVIVYVAPAGAQRHRLAFSSSNPRTSRRWRRARIP